VTHDSDATASNAVDLTGGIDNIAGKTGTSTMDLSNIQQQYPSLYQYTQGGYYNTAAAWFNGFTSKLEAAVAVARYVQNPLAGQPGQPQTIEMPVDNINNSGYAYGASLALPVWSEFMKLMQQNGNQFAGDPAFPTPNISGMQIMGSPSASASPSNSPNQQPSDMPPSTPTGPATPSDSSTCSNGLFGLGNNCNNRSSSPSASASATDTQTKGFGGGGGGGNG
jgi:membrane peptidoglycan carboxypeptidase